MSTNTASSMRDTKYEFALLQQGPNAFGVEYTERSVAGSKPVRLQITDGHKAGERDMIGDARMARILDGLRAIEEIIDEEHTRLEAELEMQGLTAPRDKVHALVKQAEDARAQLAATSAQQQALLEDAQAKLAVVANMHAQIDNALVEKNAAVATLDEQISKAADALAEYQTELAAKEASVAALEAATEQRKVDVVQLAQAAMKLNAKIAESKKVVAKTTHKKAQVKSKKTKSAVKSAGKTNE